MASGMLTYKQVELKSCKHCHHVFQWFGYGPVLCPTCKKLDDEEFSKVKEYLFMHPNVTGDVLSKETGVSLNKIFRWLQEERLIAPEAKLVGLVCEHCGTPIYKGKLCDKCKRELADDAGLFKSARAAQMLAAQQIIPQAAMRFIQTH